MPTWPDTLPDFQSGLRETYQDGAQRTPMDAGPSKSRPRFSAVARMIETSITINAAQRATLDTFYLQTTVQGTATFDHIDPKDGETRTFQFAAPPSFTHLAGAGGVTRVQVASLSLVIHP